MKALTIIVGLILLVVGILLWIGPLRAQAWTAVLGGIVVGLILVGLGALMIGISEIRSAAEEKRLTAELAASAPQQEQPSGGTGGQPTGGQS